MVDGQALQFSPDYFRSADSKAFAMDTMVLY